MKIRQVRCKTVLSKSSLPGLVYSLNPYKGCQHNCAYCYVPNLLMINRHEWGCFVDVKINIPLILSKELKKKKPGVVGISTVTDPYQPVEKKYKLTRYCLEQLLRYDFPISIQTKSSLVIRDIDIVTRFSDAEVMMSIATLNETERRLLEPHSSSIKERLNALQEYSGTGIKTSVFFGPIYPTIKKEELPQIIDTFIECGVSEIMIDVFHLKRGVRDNLELNLHNNPYVLNEFSKNLFKNQDYYLKIREEIKQVCKEKNIAVLDAF